MPGVFRRGGGSRPEKPNPFGARLSGVVPQIPAEPDTVEPDTVEPDTAEPDGGQPVQTGPEQPGPPARANPTTLAAGAPAPAGAAKVFTLRAGYNVPTPDPFARNRQRVGRSFGEVLVSEGVLLLRLRRKRVGRLLPPLRVLPEEIRLASPTETDFMGNNRGVVLERQDGEHLYVWVDEPVPLLTVLLVHGFPVGEDPVPVSRAG